MGLRHRSILQEYSPRVQRAERHRNPSAGVPRRFRHAVFPHPVGRVRQHEDRPICSREIAFHRAVCQSEVARLTEGNRDDRRAGSHAHGAVAVRADVVSEVSRLTVSLPTRASPHSCPKLRSFSVNGPSVPARRPNRPSGVASGTSIDGDTQASTDSYFSPGSGRAGRRATGTVRPARAGTVPRSRGIDLASSWRILERE